MKKTTVVLFAAAMACAVSANGQMMRRGTIEGTVLSRVAAVGETLLTVPPDRAFVLTQFCSDDLRSVKLAIDGFGDLPGQCCSTARPCIRYEPGIALPPNASVRCAASPNLGFGTRCLITGLAVPATAAPPAP